MIKKLLIANRGEIACRIIDTCRELGIKTVAIYSDIDRESKHVDSADQSVYVGESAPQKSYLNADVIINSALKLGVNAIHPGYGFLAENADFAKSVLQKKLIWIGPNPQSIKTMGDKEKSRGIAIANNINVLPGSERFTDFDAEFLKSNSKLVGFPLLVKAAGGGGGIGMSLVHNITELEKAAKTTQELAHRLFGNGNVYLERFITRARHIEVQIFGFGDGRVVHLFERECSIQRRFQKVIEESPSTKLNATTRQAICSAAVTLAAKQNYSGAGTVEFIFDDDTGEYFFLEMNTRIQVEHPVTEMLTGIDIVALQIRLAQGDNLDDIKQESIISKGHSIECRLYAENPQKMFLPVPGKIDILYFPETAKNIRIDSGLRQGDVMSAYYDSMIAKIIVHDENRIKAMQKMLDTLANIKIEGLNTNLKFLQNCIAHQKFRSGNTTTTFIQDNKMDLVN